jgi:hypothetical protein
MNNKRQIAAILQNYFLAVLPLLWSLILLGTYYSKEYINIGIYIHGPDAMIVIAILFFAGLSSIVYCTYQTWPDISRLIRGVESDKGAEVPEYVICPSCEKTYFGAKDIVLICPFCCQKLAAIEDLYDRDRQSERQSGKISCISDFEPRRSIFRKSIDDIRGFGLYTAFEVLASTVSVFVLIALALFASGS